MVACCQARSTGFERDSVERLVALEEGDIREHGAVHRQNRGARSAPAEFVDSAANLRDRIPQLRLTGNAAARPHDYHLANARLAPVGQDRLQHPKGSATKIDMELLHAVLANRGVLFVERVAHTLPSPFTVTSQTTGMSPSSSVVIRNS
jgi:hypothetical protein